MTIDLALRDDPDLLVASFDSLLDKHCGPEVVRAAEPLGFHAPRGRPLTPTGPPAHSLATATDPWALRGARSPGQRLTAGSSPWPP